MTDNEIIIYGFNLENSDPDFQRFVRSLSNEDVHNLRKILYESKLDKYRDGYGAAIYGRDRYGCVDIPNSIRAKKWEESDKELFPFIKNLWVASVLGFDDPGLNPFKNIAWKSTRARAVTTHDEGWNILSGVALEIGLSYIGAKFGVNPAAKQVGQALNNVKLKFPRIREGNGIFGKKGITIKDYKIESMYQNGGGGTIFSIKQLKNSGNSFRIDYGTHNNLIPYWHYHYRWLKKGNITGSNKPHPIYMRNILEKGTIIGAIGSSFKGDSRNK